jgi:two-component system chemotaxis response regulator CheB
MSKIKVLVVDDSAIVRNILSNAIENQPDMELLGTAPDPYIARDKIVRLEPDIITLDIEMPRMDGLTFLEKLMIYNPLPVIIVSSVTTQDNLAAIKALELGAYDVVNKPGVAITVEEVKEDVLQKIRAAYKNKDTFLEKWKNLSNSILKERPKKARSLLTVVKTTEKLIAIGSSTGGTVALEYVFTNLPQNLPPIVVVQHMPETFTAQFAKRLNELSELTIKEGEQDELLQIGTAYIAPGGYHMEVKRVGASLFINLNKKEKVNYQRPAVDPLFFSVAENAGINSLAILLTGMGRDGAAGLLRIKEAGGKTIAQDEKTSIVWGMPKAAIDLKAANEVLPLDKIPEKIINFASS